MDWKKGVDHKDVLFGVINIIETLGGLKKIKDVTMVDFSSGASHSTGTASINLCRVSPTKMDFRLGASVATLS